MEPGLWRAAGSLALGRFGIGFGKLRAGSPQARRGAGERVRTAGLAEAPEGGDEEAKGLKGCGHWGGLRGLHRQCTVDQGAGQVGEWPVAGGV